MKDIFDGKMKSLEIEKEEPKRVIRKRVRKEW
jgi:hypothetical protein